MHILPLTDCHQPAYVTTANGKEARNGHPRIPVSIHGALFFLLAFAGETWALENTRHTLATPAPQSTRGTALISSSSILTLFKLHHKFMLWHWVHRASGKNITVFANENQSILSSSGSYTKLSLDGLDHMPRRKCAADVWEVDEGEGEKSLLVGDKWFWRECAPGETWRARTLNHVQCPQKTWQRAPTAPNTLKPSP